MGDGAAPCSVTSSRFWPASLRPHPSARRSSDSEHCWGALGLNRPGSGTQTQHDSPRCRVWGREQKGAQPSSWRPGRLSDGVTLT